MLFLSPGIVYWLQTLLHTCDSNAVFIVDVSRVYAISSSIKAYTHTAFLKLFRVIHEKRTKDALKIGYQHFKRSPNLNVFVVKNINHLQNFRSDGLSQDISCKEMINQ